MSRMRIALVALATLSAAAGAQAPTQAAAARTAQQDHLEMLAQLGIRRLRPGPSGDERAPNHANYDDATATPFATLPDPLLFRDGTRVTTPAQWARRRAEIVEDFEREVYGRVPKDVPPVTWRVTVQEREFVGRTPVVAKQLVGHVDNRAHPAVDVNIAMTVVVPANAKGPVPLLIMFGRAALPAPVQPAPDDLDRLNAALRALLARDTALKAILDRYPAYQPLGRATPPPGNFGGPPLPADQDPLAAHQLLAAGWGYVLLDPSSIQEDNGAGLTRGIIGLVNRGRPRKPDDWGALRAWAWGAARALDYLETDPAVDAKHVGIEGVSRYGKAALVTLAFEPRFAMGLIGSSGKGGATLHRRNFGEAVESLTGSGEYHWMAGNYLKYGAEEATFGRRDASALPVDSHELLALCAPRLTFVSYGIPEKGDAKWLDQRGSWMATVAAGPVFRLLGARDVGVAEHWLAASMPPVNQGLLDGQLAWRQHDGGHTDLQNVKHFIAWADRFMERAK